MCCVNLLDKTLEIKQESKWSILVRYLYSYVKYRFDKTILNFQYPFEVRQLQTEHGEIDKVFNKSNK